jgi:NitT/TauT family transport system ATP-binding protein
LTIELKGVSKTFVDTREKERVTVLDGLDLTLSNRGAGRFVALLGPSGCGKSTTLGLISGLMAPDPGGEVRVNGELLAGPNPLSATVPQAYTCFPWRSVLGNVEFGLALRHVPRKERKAEALNYLNKVGLGDRQHARPRQLSGGMQQRVAIARALVLRPPLVLMDEPFGALDAQTRAEMQAMLLKLWGEERNMIVFVTHDITEALLLADQVVVFPQRPVRRVESFDLAFGRPRRTSDEAFTLCAEGMRHLLNPGVSGREFALCSEVLRGMLRSHAAGEELAPYGRCFREVLAPATPEAARLAQLTELGQPPPPPAGAEPEASEGPAAS